MRNVPRAVRAPSRNFFVLSVVHAQGRHVIGNHDQPQTQVTDTADTMDYQLRYQLVR